MGYYPCIPGWRESDKEGPSWEGEAMPIVVGSVIRPVVSGSATAMRVVAIDGNAVTYCPLSFDSPATRRTIAHADVLAAVAAGRVTIVNPA